MWKSIERYPIFGTAGTADYRLVPPDPNQFDLKIIISDLAHVQMDALVDKDLEHYMEYNMSDKVSQSVEG